MNFDEASEKIVIPTDYAVNKMGENYRPNQMLTMTLDQYLYLHECLQTHRSHCERHIGVTEVVTSCSTCM